MEYTAFSIAEIVTKQKRPEIFRGVFIYKELHQSVFTRITEFAVIFTVKEINDNTQ